MEVTEVRVFRADEDDERLKAYATVTFDNCFVVRDLKIINGNSGLFVAMPSKKRKDGTYKDIAHPIHSDFRQALENTILEKYNEENRGSSVARTETASAAAPIERVLQTEDNQAPEDLVAYSSLRDFEAGVGPASVKK